MYMEDKLNPTTNLWDQNVYINDKLVSSVSTSTLREPGRTKTMGLTEYRQRTTWQDLLRLHRMRSKTMHRGSSTQ